MDERFVMHRYKSTRLAAGAGAVLVAAWLNYAWFVEGELRWDLVSIAAAMIVTKVAAMLYYHYTQ